MEDRKNVLILCTRNTARSQMAEALLKKHAADRFNVFSAGLRPDQVHPMVEPVMNEIGVDVSGQHSKDVGKYLGTLAVHHLIIVCNQVEQHCPRLFPGALQRHFWPFEDPAAIEGTDEERRDAFRRVRDQIDLRLQAWLSGVE